MSSVPAFPYLFLLLVVPTPLRPPPSPPSPFPFPPPLSFPFLFQLHVRKLTNGNKMQECAQDWYHILTIINHPEIPINVLWVSKQWDTLPTTSNGEWILSFTFSFIHNVPLSNPKPLSLLILKRYLPPSPLFLPSLSALPFPVPSFHLY